MSTEVLDTYVQTTLKDYSISPWRRAKEAARAIRAQVLADEGLDEDTSLPIPLEWEHRVSGLSEPVPHPVADLIDAEVEHGEVMEWEAEAEVNLTLAEVQQIEKAQAGEVRKDSESLKESFDAMFDGDDATAQEKFDEFWDEFWRGE